MDTKLKSRHKLAAVIVLLLIFVPAFMVISRYPQYYRESQSVQEKIKADKLCDENFLKLFLESGYVLYNMENSQHSEEESVAENITSWGSRFEYFYPFLDYRAEDEDGKVVAQSTANSSGVLSRSNLSSYEMGMVISYDEEGNPNVEDIVGDYKKDQSIVLRKLIGSTNLYDEYSQYEDSYVETPEVNRPVNRTYLYGITEENLQEYLNLEHYTDSAVPDHAVYMIVALLAAVCAAACLLPMFPSLGIGGQKIFQVPFEIAAVVSITVLGLIGTRVGWVLTRGKGYADYVDFLIWIGAFGLAFWAASCFRQIKTLGIHTYAKERTLLFSTGKYTKDSWRGIFKWGKEKADKLYRSFEEIDLRDEHNKFILKLVGINFVILIICCSLWFFGILGLIIYSVILFLILRKYFNDLKEKYKILLKATNEIAEGNLEVEINEDLGVFSPFREEIQKIQTGFKKAVDEEVKSQKMKTELITNMSHDLKTPLTAIITYVNLLKEEKDEEKRQSYVEVLDRKSLRLKVLIEDLFEISKASSDNVTLNLMKVDIVNLFKQVKLELDDKIQQANLDFRCSFPEEKLIIELDSQKTYRIFENLVVNIIKYAMPHTRVYIEMFREDKDVVVRMKNVSQEELNFNPEEITDRFVRGDVSRNTEGSGLGLAIAKSFTELQKGKLTIETEADLFKVEIRWK